LSGKSDEIPRFAWNDVSNSIMEKYYDPKKIIFLSFKYFG